jgi:hypothetical protein
MFMTAELVFVVLMLAAEKSKDTFIAPIGIGLALFVAMMGGTCFRLVKLVSRFTVSIRRLTKHRCLLHRWFAEPGS